MGHAKQPVGRWRSFFLAGAFVPLVLFFERPEPVGTENVRLCLWQVHQMPLPNFEPVGLTTTEAIGSGVAVTMWSGSGFFVAQLSTTGETIESLLQSVVPPFNSLSAALTSWGREGPVVEALDADTGDIRIINMATGKTATRRAIPGATAASAALREVSGWVRAHKVELAEADTSAIVIFGARARGTEGSVTGEVVTEALGRRIDRLLHLRLDGERRFLVQEAGFPFATIRFSGEGAETWRGLPKPEEIRDLLGEDDLRYVIATPAMSLDNAVLSTFVALRSGRRIAAIRQPNEASVRYREIPADLAFLGSFPTHRLLVGTRSGQPYELVVFSWRWIDQREPCTNPPT